MTNKLPDAAFPSHNPENFSVGEHMRNKAELMLLLSELLEKLPTYLQPIRTQTDMSFFPYGDHTYAYPEVLSNITITADLEDVIVSITRDETEAPATSITLAVSSGDVIHISRDPSIIDSREGDSLIRGSEILAIDRVPDTDIQSFLLSLSTLDCTPTTIQDIEDSDLLVPNAAHNELALRTAAMQTMTISDYPLSGNRSIQFITTEHDDDSHLETLNLSYETGSGRNMMLTLNQERIIGSLTSEIQFRRYIDNELVDFLPDDGDLIRAAEIVQDEIDFLEQKRIKAENDVSRILSAKSLTLFDLDQDSLDPPNASA